MFLSKQPIYILLLSAVIVAVLLVSAVALAQPRVTFRFNLSPGSYADIPQSPQISLSVDRGEGAAYEVGEPITIRYRATSGGYINLLHYQSDGSVSVLVRDQFVTQGSTRSYNGTITGPSGTERVVVLLTPDVVSDRNLEDFIREPHRAGRIFRNYATNRTHYSVMARVTATTLRIDPASFSIDPDGSVVLTATLRDENGRLLAGRQLEWSTNRGSLGSSITTTSPQGQSRNTFYAPAGDRGPVTITVRFHGDRMYEASSARTTADVRSPVRPPRLSINPSTFTVTSGERVRLEATLRDEQGNPVFGRTIFWSAESGDFDRTSAITGSSGRVVVYYYAPTVRLPREVEINAEFRGAPGLSPVSQYIVGTVEPERVRPRSPRPVATSFSLDFSSGSPIHDGIDVRYSGRIVTGYAQGGRSTLELRPGDSLEFTFDPGELPQRASIIAWVQGEPRTNLNVVLNNRYVGRFNPVRGTLSPDDDQRLTVTSSDLIDGINRLVLEWDGPRPHTDPIRIQRIMIVF